MRTAIAAAVLALLPARARAYHPARRFEQNAVEGGGAGVFFTGSPRFRRWDCAICHVDPPGRIAAVLRSDPADLERGRWAPDTTYVVRIELYGEHRGLGTRANENTFVAEIVDDAGAPEGRFAFDPEAYLGFLDRRLVASRGMAGMTSWTVEWSAPPAGSGPLTLYLGMVDGDGAGDTSTARTDPLGDDVTMVALRLCEGGGSCDPPRAAGEPRSPAACAVMPRGAEPGAWVVLVAIGLAVALGRRRRALLLAAILSACHDPRLPAECPDRICGDAGGSGRDAGEEPPPDSGQPPCREDWFCGSWEAPPGSDEATRSCVDRAETGTAECRPETGPVTLPDLDFPMFQCDVEPILDRDCSMMGCHGTERPLRVFSRGRLRNSEIVDRVDTCLERGTVDLREAGTGTVMCEGWLPHTEAEWKKNFDSARSFLLGVAAPGDSELLRQPVVGGMPHEGVHPFTEDEPDYEVVRAWLAGGRRDSCDPRPN